MIITRWVRERESIRKENIKYLNWKMRSLYLIIIANNWIQKETLFIYILKMKGRDENDQ